MAIDKAKIQKGAEKLIAAGKIPQAVDEYLKILKEFPKDWNMMIQIGDLYLRINKNDDAIPYFEKVADHYYADGFFLKAIAIYKRVNKLDPSRTEICIKLAELYLKQGLTMDAKSQLTSVAQHYLSKNQVKEAIQTYKKLLEIEPDNLKTRNELAKAYKSEGMIAEAIKEYLEISDELTRKSLLRESLQVLETAYKLDPRNTAILGKILSIYSDQKDEKRATALLEEALRVDPGNPEVLSLLAESYAGKGQYKKAHETIDGAIEKTADKEPLWLMKGEIHLKEGKLDPAFNQFLNVCDRMVRRKETEKGVALLQSILRVDPSHTATLEKLIDLYSSLHQETNVLTSYSSLVDGFISKGKYQDAERCLQKLIKLEPDNAQHQEKLEFVRSFQEKPKQEPVRPAPPPPKTAPLPPPAASRPPAPPVIPAVEEVSSEDLDLGISLEIPIEAPTPVGMKKVSMTTPKAEPPARQAAAPAAQVSLETTEEEKEFVSEHLIEAEVFTKYGLIDKAIEQLQMVVAKYPASVLAHQKLKEIYQEKGDRDKAVEECIAMSRIFRKQGDMDQAEDLLSEARQIQPNYPMLDKAYKELPSAPPPGDVMGEIERLAQSIKARPASKPVAQQPRPVQVPLPATPRVAPVQVIAPPPPPPAVEEIEIEVEEEPAAEEAGLSQSIFEEIDFYTDQGLTSEARSLLEQLREKHPDDPGVLSRLEKLAAKPAPKVEEEAEALGIEIEIEEPEPESDMELQIEAPTGPTIEFDTAGPETAVEPESPAEPEPEAEIAMEKPEEPTIENTWDLGNLSDLQEEPEKLEEIGEAEEPEEVEEAAEPGEAEQEGIELEEISADIAEEPQLEEAAAPEQAEVIALPEEETEPVAEIELPEVEAKPLLAETEEPVAEIELEAVEEQTGAEEQPAEPAPTEFAELEERGELEIEGLEESAAPSVEQGLSSEVDAAFERVEAGEQPVAEAEAEVEEPPVEQAPQETFKEEEEFFDLASELEDGLLGVQSAVEEEKPSDGQTYSLEEILSDFKKGVEKQLGSEDYDTRYNLGIAYKEMGLIDEAIAEFQIASKDEKRFLECCSMLGLCFQEKGMPKLAIKWYQRGLEVPGHTEEQYLGLRYDMAQAYEVLGEEAVALEMYQEVYGLNANYRNVAKKINELQENLHSK